MFLDREVGHIIMTAVRFVVLWMDWLPLLVKAYELNNGLRRSPPARYPPHRPLNRSVAQAGLETKSLALNYFQTIRRFFGFWQGPFVSDRV